MIIYNDLGSQLGNPIPVFSIPKFQDWGMAGTENAAGIPSFEPQY